MNQSPFPEEKEAIGATYTLPSVAIILPFEPKMVSKRKLTSSIESVVDKVEQKILENFSYDMGVLVMQKLKTIVNDLNFSTHCKSLAIYVSPVFEKILYLNHVVEEKVLVAESFHIRDLIKSKRTLKQYLLLQISSKETQLYFNDSGQLKKIFSNNFLTSLKLADESWQHLVTAVRPKSEEGKIEDFLQIIDNKLDFIIESYSLPFLVIGQEKMISQFKNITKHTQAITEYVTCNYEDPDIEVVKKIIAPYLADWKKLEQKKQLNLLSSALDKKKLVTGIKDVYKQAMNYNGKLLLVEEDYKYPATYNESEEMIYKATQSFSPFSYLKDAVDEIIEKVLEENGDVEFVEKELLKNYDHIALIL